jgi:dolichol-phosphate mannosyltransferase
MNLSIVILTLDKKESAAALIPRLREVLASAMRDSQYEIIVVDRGSSDGTIQVAAQLADHLVLQMESGYGKALRAGFAVAQGRYVATLDSDLICEPSFLLAMYEERTSADVIIASRYVAGGGSDMPLIRTTLSRILNLVFRTALSLPIEDVSSGFRLYNARVLKEFQCTGISFDILPEIIIRCLAEGWRVRELPFCYYPRPHGGFRPDLLKLGLAYLTTLTRMWRLRNSVESADYDERAFDSRIPFQRYWQRKRYRIITEWVPSDVTTLDIGCGSSRILRNLDEVVGLDIELRKLRYMRRYDKRLVNGTIMSLPFPDESFDCVICSQVIEHIPYDAQVFSELDRVLSNGGTLIIGTPDYGSRLWKLIEAVYAQIIPGGYADEHITHYTLDILKDYMKSCGFGLERVSSILGAEVILCLQKKSCDQTIQNTQIRCQGDQEP